jgi:hypothetical protein
MAKNVVETARLRIGELARASGLTVSTHPMRSPA